MDSNRENMYKQVIILLDFVKNAKRICLVIYCIPSADIIIPTSPIMN